MKVVNQTDQITIVEYDPTYAEAVAEMWNNSRDGWGGHNAVKTKEQVLKEEANSTNLHLFLALDGEKVIGYCSLGEYREDEGALYIPLLNVRGDYHGKKVGKKLVLHALKRAIELEWPRLDLYTWAGNTKAVPLYKKCGFFWEERDDATHLMNFMPTVIQTEAVRDFFQEVNWYEASTRVIEVKPDGNKENDFHYYAYSWKNENQDALRMEFERFGRGLRLIETDDYLISATVEDFNLVFGSEYTVTYHIKNKSGKPLNVSLEGVSDKTIDFTFSEHVTVQSETIIEKTFHVGAIDEEQSVWRTHPSVNTLVTINGKQASLKVGIRPKFPVNVTCKAPDVLTFLGKSSRFTIDLENNFNEEVTFSFELPESEMITLKQRSYQITISPKGKVSIPVEYVLLKHGFYEAELVITAVKQDGASVQFTKKTGAAFKGIGSKFSGETDKGFYLYNGPYHLILDKFDNWIAVKRGKKDYQISLMFPKLGKPFSEEMARLRPEKVEPMIHSGWAGFKATYLSKAFPGLVISSVVKLYSEGLLQYHYEVTNTNTHETTEEVWLNNPIFSRLLDRAVIPYRNRFIELKDAIGQELSYWNASHMTENWLFLKGQKNPRGICWSNDDQIQFSGWYVYFEHNFGKLAEGQTVQTKPITVSIGAFDDWQSFRAYALETEDDLTENETNEVTISVNNENPFVAHGENIVTINDYKTAYFNGIIETKVNENIVHSSVFSADEKATSTEFEVVLPSQKDIHLLLAKMNLDASEINRQTVAFIKKDTPIHLNKRVIDGQEVFSVDNGKMNISAAPGFAPSLYSVNYQDHEWMDSSFPKAAPKSWWNPWCGGISSILDGVSPNSLIKEKSTAEFTSLLDSKNNHWQGIKVTTIFNEHVAYKGLLVNQYFMMLPGVPVLAHTTEIVQNTGTFLDDKKFYTGCFLKPAEEKTNAFGSFQDEQGDWSVIFGGKGEHEMSVDRSLIFGSADHDHLLQIVANRNMTFVDSYINKEVMEVGYFEMLRLKHGESYMTSPVFYLFHDEVIPEHALENLKKITF